MRLSETKLRSYASLLSLVVGISVMGLKFYAYSITKSTAILSDALESIVNVVAAAFLLWTVKVSEEPPDEGHPYGHGKLEFVTAIFEGGLITFAAIMIGYEAIAALIYGAHPQLEEGLWIILTAGMLNGLLAFTLIFIGKKTSSLAITADGKHVFSDFLTSVGVILGLGIVKWTGITWIDPAIAFLMALLLAYTGVPIVSQAINGLIDAADVPLLQKILDAMEANRFPGIIRVHHVRAMRIGRKVHIDGHIVVPEFWSVEEAHDQTEDFEDKILQQMEGEMEFHVDPCRKLYCSVCDLESCTLRTEPFLHRPPFTLQELQSMVDITDRAKKS